MTLLNTFLPLAIETPTPSLLQPNAGIVFWTVVVFLTVLGILWKFASGTITRGLVKRESTIDEPSRRAEQELAGTRKIQSGNEIARSEAEQADEGILRHDSDSAKNL